ncbi:MAG: hypothetical protein ACOC5T_10190, partial [Elusimicrobiota bacterium]
GLFHRLGMLQVQNHKPQILKLNIHLPFSLKITAFTEGILSLRANEAAVENRDTLPISVVDLALIYDRNWLKLVHVPIFFLQKEGHVPYFHII